LDVDGLPVHDSVWSRDDHRAEGDDGLGIVDWNLGGGADLAVVSKVHRDIELGFCWQGELFFDDRMLSDGVWS